MSSGDYLYAIDFYTVDGRRLGREPISPDWGPALEWVNFLGVREGRIPATLGCRTGEIEPVWHPAAGRPYVRSVRVVLHGTESDPVSGELTDDFFQPGARLASRVLVERGLLKEGDRFRFLVCAFRAPANSEEPDSEGGLAVEEVVRPLPLGSASLDDFVPPATRSGERADAGGMPVLIRDGVLEEILELSLSAGDVETGGVLVGKLYRDSGDGRIFLEIRAQIPARHTDSRSTRLTFTPETWAAVDDALGSREQDELLAGWWHSHLPLCRRCDPEKRRQCRFSSEFLSAHDLHLHRTCFVRAFQVALLVGRGAGGGCSWSLFGWRRGAIASREFRVVGDPDSLPRRGRGETSSPVVKAAAANPVPGLSRP